jgi:hypothetical protein
MSPSAFAELSCYGGRRLWRRRRRCTAPYVAGQETEGLRRARWNRQWLYEAMQLFNSYKVRWFQPKVAPPG